MKTKCLLILILLPALNASVIAQPNSGRYTSLEDALRHKGTCEWLDLSKQDIGLLSDSLFHLTNLKYLDLSRTQLQELPARIGELKQLRYLVLSYNHLKMIPKEISRLHLLRTGLLAALLFYTSFPVVNFGGTPMVDAWAYAFLLLGLVAALRGSLAWLGIASLVGMLAKETSLLLVPAKRAPRPM